MNSFDYHHFQEKKFIKIVCQLKFWSLYDPAERENARKYIQEQFEDIEESMSMTKKTDHKRSRVTIKWGADDP